MKKHRSERLLSLAVLLALPALGLMALSILVPTPGPVMLSMSLAQGLGGAAFALYLVVVLRSLRNGSSRDSSSVDGGDGLPRSRTDTGR